MPTTIVTGRDITFTIDGDSYDAQATSDGGKAFPPGRIRRS